MYEHKKPYLLRAEVIEVLSRIYAGSSLFLLIGGAFILPGLTPEWWSCGRDTAYEVCRWLGFPLLYGLGIGIIELVIYGLLALVFSQWEWIWEAYHPLAEEVRENRAKKAAEKAQGGALSLEEKE